MHIQRVAKPAVLRCVQFADNKTVKNQPIESRTNITAVPPNVTHKKLTGSGNKVKCFTIWVKRLLGHAVYGNVI